MPRAHGLDHQLLASGRRSVAQQAELATIGTVGPEAHAAPAADLGKRRRALAVGIGDGDAAGRQQLLEQARLGGKVGVHRGVIVEMLVRQVGEGRRRELEAIEPMLVEAMARRLDGKMGNALACQGREIGMELHRIGRGEARLTREARRDDA